MPDNPRILAGRANVLKRHRGPDHPETVKAVRDLHEAQLERHIRELVDAWPPLSDSQRERLAALLAPAGGESE